MCVSTIFCHLVAGGGVTSEHKHFIIVVLGRTAWIKLEIEVLGSRKGDSLLELVVVSDRMYGLHCAACSPGSWHLDGIGILGAPIEEIRGLIKKKKNAPLNDN